MYAQETSITQLSLEMTETRCSRTHGKPSRLPQQQGSPSPIPPSWKPHAGDSGLGPCGCTSAGNSGIEEVAFPGKSAKFGPFKVQLRNESYSKMCQGEKMALL
ncbi:hypothetical protein Y1Q_0017266 [Alligator mississippiensis]|uniref:Uncharacterized protein n=1 Tax=Alligator mississippiensis TaxID=8496 RepID=A0A151NKY3_ALLMI|nr:hypothetical protein Y1Q_0017266 [Alligator mississippiensis]